MSLLGNGGSGKESIRSKLWNISRRQWAALLLLGLLLAVIAIPVSDKEVRNTDASDTAFLLTGMGEEEGEDTSKTELEGKLETLLSHVEGVGGTEVMLMTGRENGNTGFYDSGETKITGVLIAAQGADDPSIVRNIQQAVMALFQIEAHKIKIMKMK